MTPLCFFESLFKTINIFLKFFRIDLFDPDFVPGFFERAFLLAVMLSAIPAIFYTLFAYDLPTALKAFTMLSIIVQVSFS